jgi:hypothetical protein
MASTRKRSKTAGDSAEQDIRQQEVLRANRELAAYFKGRRTEREARAALKIIKAFIRDRERLDPAVRRPLPGAASSTARAAKERPRKRSGASARDRQRSSVRRQSRPRESADRQVLSEPENHSASVDGSETPSA